MRKSSFALSVFVFLLTSLSILPPDSFSPELFVQNFKKETTFFNYPEIEKIIKEPLRYLGHGGQAMAFESIDGKYVIKFFLSKRIHRYTRIKPFSIYQRFFSNKPFNTTRDRSQILLRYQKAFELLQEETGLIAIHLSPSTPPLPSCSIIDYNGKMHQVDLSTTSFVIQKRGQPLEVASSQKALLELMEKIAIKGFKNRSKRFNKNNFALIGNKAIMIDLGHISFSKAQKIDPSEELIKLRKIL